MFTVLFQHYNGHLLRLSFQFWIQLYYMIWMWTRLSKCRARHRWNLKCPMFPIPLTFYLSFRLFQWQFFSFLSSESSSLVWNSPTLSGSYSDDGGQGDCEISGCICLGIWHWKYIFSMYSSDQSMTFGMS